MTGFDITQSIPALTVFIQGLLSFFSPCVLPLLPVYIGYLSGGTASAGEDGKIRYNRKNVLINAAFFVLGIGFSFFVLGLGMRALGRFFSGNRLLFARIGGVIAVLFGLYQLGVFGSSAFLSKERKLPFHLQKAAVSPLTALIMGFVFSFSWTPCVGPTLSGVLLMAGSAQSSTKGFLLIGIYTLGFIIPFLLTGVFTTSLLELFRKHRNVLKYTAGISGILLIVMGIMMITGYMNTITGYLSQFNGQQETVETSAAPEETEALTLPEKSLSAEEETQPLTETEPQEAEEPYPAPDFRLTDQYGREHSLSDYRGKIIFLNFWATWCPPCRAEMPAIQELYETFSNDPDSDVVILGVAFPGLSGEQDEEGIKAFLKENGYTYPTVMDTTGQLAYTYYITAYPMTFMIDPDGNFYGYVTGSIPKETMLNIIEQTREYATSKKDR